MEDYKSYFDARLRASGKSIIITIPTETIQKLQLEVDDIVRVAISDNEKP